MQQMQQTACVLWCLLASLALTGCYVPLRSPGIPASCLGDEFRMPLRSMSPHLNLASLSVPPSDDYLLGTNDELAVRIPGLAEQENQEAVTLNSRVMADGTVSLPIVGDVQVGGMNLSDAQQAINAAYAEGVIVNPRVTVSLFSEAAVDIAVMGAVTRPGVYALPSNQRDVAHALAMAGGRTPLAADFVEIHRRLKPSDLTRRIPPVDDEQSVDASGAESLDGGLGDETMVITIPLRGGEPTASCDQWGEVERQVNDQELVLRPGDVVVAPRQPAQVFFVVGPLSENNVVNFRVSELDRQLGNAFLLPKDRDVDTVTAVAMAGYIDPIYSPTTVTVHRSVAGQSPLLIHVDLIAARHDWQENVYVQPGDIIYLNPDPAWWSRRTFDRILPDLLTIPYSEAMLRWINPGLIVR